MLTEKVKKFHIILASSSPRRQEFFKNLGLEYEVRLNPVEEIYPEHLMGVEIADFLSKLKAGPFLGELKANDLLITSDTIVWHKDTFLGKPEDDEQAFLMLRSLSGGWHEVITSVCFTRINNQRIVNSTTQVKFSDLTNGEIRHYIKESKPFDKAGGYGIQDWIGLIGIEEIRGSYTNVVGLPTQLVYKTLMLIANQ
ncbi:MAG: septum formation protein Maf [Flavobacteriaceae bacterium]|nr:MAG: septum formation protein Maf [Flavobacteriaceae bacterium]